MATLTQQLYSQNHWTGVFDGVQTIWNFTFSGGYIMKSHVKAYYLDAAGAIVNVTVTEDMFSGPYQLTISPAIPASATRLVIYRDTPKDLPLVDFEDGARVTELNLDRIARQAIFVAAEVLDGAAVSGPMLAELLERIEEAAQGLVAQDARLDALEALTADYAQLGYKSLKRNAYTGTSNVLAADNGKAHYKTDGTAVTVPAGLPDEFMTTIINGSASAMTLTMAETAYLQIGTPSVFTSAAIAARGTATVVKVGSVWLVSGTVS